MRREQTFAVRTERQQTPGRSRRLRIKAFEQTGAVTERMPRTEQKRGAMRILILIGLVFVRIKLCLTPRRGRIKDDGKKRTVSVPQQFPV